MKTLKEQVDEAAATLEWLTQADGSVLLTPEQRSCLLANLSCVSAVLSVAEYGNELVTRALADDSVPWTQLPGTKPLRETG